MRGIPRRGLPASRMLFPPENLEDKRQEILKSLPDEVKAILGTLTDSNITPSDGTPEGEIKHQMSMLSLAISRAYKEYTNMPMDVGLAYGLSSLVSASANVIKLLKTMEAEKESKENKFVTALTQLVTNTLKELIDSAKVLRDNLMSITTNEPEMTKALHEMLRDTCSKLEEERDSAITLLEAKDKMVKVQVPQPKR